MVGKQSDPVHAVLQVVKECVDLRKRKAAPALDLEVLDLTLLLQYNAGLWIIDKHWKIETLFGYGRR